MIQGWSTEGYIETRILNQQAGRPILKQSWHPVDNLWEVESAIREGDKLDHALPCVAPGIRRDVGSTKVDSVVAINVLWADLDWKRYAGGEDEAKVAVRAFPLTPHCIVRSGGGFHLYWRLAEPWDVSTEEERARANGTLRRIASMLGADMAPAHVGAVLRAPETTNRKYNPFVTSQISYWAEP